MSSSDPQPPTAEGAATAGQAPPYEAPFDVQASLFSTRIARLASGVALAIAIVVLIGWWLRVEALTSVLPHLASMKAETALCVALSAAALAALSAPVRTKRLDVLFGVCTGVSATIAALIMFEYLSSIDLGIDRVLWHDAAPTAAAPFPGRMGLNSATALVFLAIALVSKRRAGTRALAWSDACSVGVFLVALFPALGYLYGAPALTGVAAYTQMAVHTAGAILLLAIGVVTVPPFGPIMDLFTSTGPGGVLARRLIPLYSITVVLIGWLRLQGQLRGLYGSQVGVALMVVACVVIFAVATGATARVINAAAAERKRTQDDLEQHELVYRLLVGATFDGIVIAQHGKIRDANAGYATMFGYAQEELIGKSVYDLVSEESLELVREKIRTGVHGGYDVVGVRKDGSRFTFETFVRTHGEGPDQLRVAALRDTTNQRRLEEQLRQSQKMDAIGHLAGGVAHDFNNLLTVILSYTLLLLREQHSARTREELQQILKAAESASGLTRQLLAFSRRQVLEPKLVSLNTVVTHTEKLLTRVLGEDIALRSVLASDLLAIKADPGQLEQVLMNLAVNARDAMPQGGRLTIETENIELDAQYVANHQAVPPGQYVQLTVTDTGVGMDDQTKSHIFEPFFTTKAVGKGTGLGLASVYGIVQQTGGHIWVYSEVGHGTTFKLYFPATSETIETPNVPVWTLPACRGTETILLAEDAEDVRELTRSVLETLGYKVLDVGDPAAALKVSRLFPDPIALLLTDVVMPGMSGRQLADLLTVERGDMKVLFVSGYTSDTVLQRGILGPGMTLLQKPYTPDTLARKVREVLDEQPVA